MQFIELLLADKLVAVWGTGYLGYTSMLRMQGRGFSIRLVELYEKSLQLDEVDAYPCPAQRSQWSATGNIPPLNWENIQIQKDYSQMFSENVHIHLICIPPTYRSGAYNGNIISLAEIFKANAKKFQKPLVIFQSASGPGTVDREFLDRLGEKSANYHVGVAFRSDWTVEEFLAHSEPQVVSGQDEESAALVGDFHSLFNQKVEVVGTIKQAELLENARNALEFTSTAFLSQLAQAYPDIDINSLAPLIINPKRLENCLPGMGSGGFRMPTAITHLLRETPYSEQLSLLQESSTVNLSTMLVYKDYLIRRSVKSVLLLGVRYQLEASLSPSVVIAQGLVQEGVEVSVHDPVHTPEKIVSLVPGANHFELEPDGFEKFDAILVGSDCPEYSFISQSTVDEFINGKVGLVIDAASAWTRYTFSQETEYHCVGDGSLDVLK